MALWRQGDIYLQTATAKAAEGCHPRHDLILARGELTGHSHRIAERGSATLFEGAEGVLWLQVPERASVIHDEHRPIELEGGWYKVWRQREYTPQAIRIVQD